jgi:hypothetical protein
MLTQCANPLCSKPLHYLREGKVYRVEIKEEPADASTPFLISDTGKKQNRLQHYWLCGECTKNVTLRFDNLGHITVVPKVMKIAVMSATIQDQGLAKKAAAS